MDQCVGFICSYLLRVFTVPSACLAISERCTWVMYSKSLAWCQSLWMAERSLSIRKRAEIDTMDTKLKSTAFRTATSSLPHHYHARFFWIPVILSHNRGGKMILVSIVKESNTVGETQDCHGLSSSSTGAWLFGDFIMNHGISWSNISNKSLTNRCNLK